MEITCHESTSSASRLIESMEHVGKWYDFLNERFFENALSKPIITFQPDETCRTLGWFVPHRIWKDADGFRGFELNLSANFLDRKAEEIATTLLHEMCHQFAYVSAVKDTCRAGTYHNQAFREIAEAHGLIAYKTKQYGYAITELSQSALEIVHEFEEESLLFRKRTEEDLREEALHDLLIEQKKKGKGLAYSDSAEEIEQEIDRRVEEKKNRMACRKKSSTRKYICSNCGQSVRATRTVNILCGNCHVSMVVEESKTKEEATREA